MISETRASFGLTNIGCTLVIVMASLMMLTTADAEIVTFDNAWGNSGFNLLSQDGAGVEVIFSITEMAILDMEINGSTMQMVHIPGVHLPTDAGTPNLPGSGRYIAIPQGASAYVEIVDYRTEIFKNLDIIPSAPIPAETDDSPPVYIKNPDIYNQDAYYPEAPVLLSETRNIRGVDCIILGITPFQYNPVTKELVVYRDIKVSVKFRGGNGHFGEDRLRSRYWEPILRQHLLNYASLPQVNYDQTNPTDEDNVEYVIITPDDPEFIAWADSIKQWRIQQGISTGIVTLTELGGNTWQNIYNYLITAYWTWDPAPVAVLLLGDHENSGGQNPITSPEWDDYCVSDNMYVDMTANNLPDMAISRIPANDGDDLETMVGKVLDFERNPPTDPGFYEHPLIAGGWQDDRWFILCCEVIYGYLSNELSMDPVRQYAGYSGPLPYWSTNPNTGMIVDYFGPLGLNYIPEDPSYLTNWTGSATGINSAINSGAFLVQHRDHGSVTGWGDPAYYIGNLSGLYNDMLPFVFSTNCCTGNFSVSGDCFAEAFYNMEHGALGLNAASEVSYSFVNDTYQWGVYDSMWPDFDPGYGSDSTGSPELRTCFGNASGKYYLSASGWVSNGWSKTVTYHLLHHFGDAFTTLYSQVPQELTVLHPRTISAEITEVNVSADAGAIIGLSVGEEIVGVAEATGMPQVISITPRTPGDNIVVTATLQNHFRYTGEIEVLTDQINYVLFEDLTLSDPSGNNNQQLDLGENCLLSVELKNFGTQTAINIDANISSDDPFIELIDSLEVYPNIPSLSTATADDAFEIGTVGNIPDLHQVDFNLTATNGDSTWLSQFSLTAHAPQIQYYDFFIDDVTGNDNNHLDPGETADLQVTFYNDGTGDASDASVYIEGDSPLITIPQNSGSLNLLQSDSLGTITFADVHADSTFPMEDSVKFTLMITTTGGYIGSDEFTIAVGDSRYVPSGPDAYGYYAYDEYDGLDAPDYEWLEIAPLAGGNGTELNFDPLPFTQVMLPYNFGFYGTEYDRITVHANGWVSFDTTSVFFPQNLPIPDALPPNRLIAVFWDEMDLLSGGQVSYYHDTDNHRFIVEWYQMPHMYSTTEMETYQLVLLDPAYYPSTTGDGEIIVYYNSLSNILDGCTVGIENEEGAIGLQYLYNNEYDSLAIPLEDDFTVKFTTGSVVTGIEPVASNTLPDHYSMGQNYPNPFNPNTVLSYQLPFAGLVNVKVYDISGRMVTELVNGWRDAGIHEVTFSGQGLASGIYLIRMEAGSFSDTRKMVLLK
ncbi:hypothetical protein CEE37_07715 [candidate division LCP-89 bacterium B3_LCP]|uniref:Gingipain R n=1 Tax=candidate division LCP-89 bacterium B3_LCP TaxID=2012998 RepID=A0A532V0V4_UNCL8|nr:MAG: hypothetical protein CEE37_07715 [candidate division LCP-89 bacterium B3_LCP]